MKNDAKRNARDPNDDTDPSASGTRLRAVNDSDRALAAIAAEYESTAALASALGLVFRVLDGPVSAEARAAMPPLANAHRTAVSEETRLHAMLRHLESRSADAANEAS